jgi:hypothetical protein
MMMYSCSRTGPQCTHLAIVVYGVRCTGQYPRIPGQQTCSTSLRVGRVVCRLRVESVGLRPQTASHPPVRPSGLAKKQRATPQAQAPPRGGLPGNQAWRGCMFGAPPGRAPPRRGRRQPRGGGGSAASPAKPGRAKKNAKKKPAVPLLPPPPGFDAHGKAAEEQRDGAILAAGNVSSAFVELMAGGGDGSFATAELVSPSHLLWSMRQYVMVQLQQELSGKRNSSGAKKVHHQAIFHEEKHGHQIQISDGGKTLYSGNGPTTVLSSVSTSSGALSWTINYVSGNNSCMIGAVRGDFDNLNRNPDVPEWTICSAHGYDGQGYTRYNMMGGEKFRVVADLDERTLRIWKTMSASEEGELLLEAEDVEGEVSLALCTWNGAKFSIEEEDSCVEGIVGAGSGGTANKKPPKTEGKAKAKSAAAAAAAGGAGLHVPSAVGLSAICDLLRQVAGNEGLSELALSALDAMNASLGALAPQELFATEASRGLEEIERLLLSIAATAAPRAAAEPPQLQMLGRAASGLIAIAAARGSENSLLDTASALARFASELGEAAHPLMVALPPIAVAFERSVRFALVRCPLLPLTRLAGNSLCNVCTCHEAEEADGPGQGVASELPLPCAAHCCASNRVMTLGAASEVGASAAASIQCFACNGLYLFVVTSANELLKLGTGSGDTEAGHVYASNTDIPGLSASSAWIGVLGPLVLLRPDSARSRHVVALDSGNLAQLETLSLPGGDDEHCSLLVANEHLCTVEIRDARVLTAAAAEADQIEPEPEADDEPEPELDEGGAGVELNGDEPGQKLVLTPCVHLDTLSGSGPVVTSSASTTFPLALRAVVQLGQDPGATIFTHRRVLLC